MIELLVTGGIVAAAVVMINRRPTRAGGTVHFDGGVDLPCPWCRAHTAESDPRCPGCGQVFG